MATDNSQIQGLINSYPADYKKFYSSRLAENKGNTREASQLAIRDLASLDQQNLQKSLAQTSIQKTANLEADSNAVKAGLVNASKQGGTKGEFHKNLYKSMGGAVGSTVNTADAAADGINQGLNDWNAWMVNSVLGLRQQSGFINNGIKGASSSVVSSVSNFGVGAIHDVQGWKQSMHQALKPVSYATGSTLGTLTQIAKNPLGAPQILANSMVSLVDKVNPGFSNEMDAAYKTVQMENLQHLPGQVMGSIRNLATAADAILSVPFTIMSDLYNGLMEIMQEIGKMVDSLMGAVMDFIFGPGGLLDSVFPISSILELLEAVGELASFCGGISQQFGGFTAIANAASQVGNSAFQASSVVSNPIQLAQSYIPGFSSVTGGIDQATGALRNPEQLFQQFLPPEISSGLNNLSNMPGLGFVGNLGYGIGGTLESLKGGVFTQAIKQFEGKSSILGPLFNQKTENPAPVNTQENQSTEYVPSKVTGGSTVQGVSQWQDTSKYKAFEEKTSQDGTTTNKAYGIEEIKDSNGNVISQSGPGWSADFKTGAITAYGAKGVTEQPFGLIPPQP